MLIKISKKILKLYNTLIPYMRVIFNTLRSIVYLMYSFNKHFSVLNLLCFKRIDYRITSISLIRNKIKIITLNN